MQWTRHPLGLTRVSLKDLVKEEVEIADRQLEKEGSE